MTPSPSPRALVDLEALAANYAFLRQTAAPAEVAAAVKANAYGLGVGPVVQTLFSAGCRTFFTAHFAEALDVREHVPEATVAVLHGLAAYEEEWAVGENIVPVINDLGTLESWRRRARSLGRPLPAYVHLDTGMNRLGLPPDELHRLAQDPSLLEGLSLKGWLSHLACADEFDNPLTTQQRDNFVRALALLPRAPASLCNSSGLFWGRDFVFDLVRPGIALYGGNPTPHLPNPMQAVLELQAPVLQVRNVDTSMTIGYGAAHRFSRRGRVATLALGYADGYHRALGERGTVMLGSHSVPLVGRISMDLITIDVTDVPEKAAHPGAMVTLIGPHRSVDDVAREGGTIAYEILTSLGPRVSRVYHEKGAA